MPQTLRKWDVALVPGRKTLERFNQYKLTHPIQTAISETAKARQNLTNLLEKVSCEQATNNIQGRDVAESLKDQQPVI